MSHTPVSPDSSQLDTSIRQGIAAEDPAPPRYNVSARMAEVVAHGTQRPQPWQRGGERSVPGRTWQAGDRRLSGRAGGILWGSLGTFAACAALFAVFQLHTRSVSTPAGNPVVVATGQGHQSTVHLPDGSSVRLAPASRVRYSTAYGNRIREIELDGEAVFTVVSANDAPFVVRARGTETRVLGTTFGIRAYESDSVVQVAVAQGRVRVGASGVLNVGDVVQVARDGSVQQVRDVAVTDLLGWTRNKIAFKDAKLTVVARELERWYDVDIDITDAAAANALVTAQFENIDLTMALEILSRSLGVTYQRQEKHVSISSR